MKTKLKLKLKITAFNLIELMSVLTIVTILVAIAIPAYNNYIVRSKIASMLQIAVNVKIAVTNEFYNNGYSLTGLTHTSGSQPYLQSDLDFIQSISVTNGIISIDGVASELKNNDIILIFTPSVDENELVWTCSCDSAYHDLVPVECKNIL